MSPVAEELRRTWRRHDAVDRALLRTLEPADLSLRTPGGGWTIEQQIAHVGAATAFWSGRLDPDRVAGLPPIHPDEPPEGAFEHDPSAAARYLGEVNAAALRAADGVGDWSDRSHASAEAFLTHMMVHAAHHRSQVLLALKVAGRPLVDDGAYWGPWKRDPES